MVLEWICPCGLRYIIPQLTVLIILLLIIIIDNILVVVIINILLRFGFHFWRVNSDFCANFINQNSPCDIREITPKSYGMGLSPPLPYGKSPQFCDFFALMASLREVIKKKTGMKRSG